MARPRPSAAGGVFVMLGAVGGAAIGFVLREPTIWFLGGLMVGALLALLIWWRGK